MPIATPTALTGATGSLGAATSATFVSASVTYAANAFLAVGCMVGSAGSPTHFPVTLSGLGVTWGSPVLTIEGTLDNWWALAIFTGITGGSGGSGTLTTTWNKSGVRHATHVVQVASGYHSSTPVRQFESGGNSGTNPNDTFASAPLSDSLILAFLNSRQASGSNLATPGTNFTELAEGVAGSGAPFLLSNVEYDQDPAGSTFNWTVVSSTNQVWGAIELAADPSGAVGQPTMRRWNGSIWPTGARRIGRGW